MTDTKGQPPPSSLQVPAGAYDDDEPVADHKAPVTNGRPVVLTTHCEFPALARCASWENFGVLVHSKAPADAARAPLNLVTVLDVSGSMDGQKLSLLKKAMGFVIDQLGPADRLSVVTFSSHAGRLTRLARMTDAGKASAKLAVQNLVSCGCTNITDGLRVASQVLAGRGHKNAVASIVILSDGHDSYYPKGTNAAHYINLIPPAFTHAGTRLAPIHTFGFGADHDAVAMHAVAEATGGTFSFVENQAAIQDSFARCVAGLTSVAVQEARVVVTCLHRGVRVQEVKYGCYDSHVEDDGSAAYIEVGELYDEEERRFLVLVYVPRVRSSEGVTRLVKVSCAYKDAATGQAAHVASPAATIQRPPALTQMPPPCADVERERVRLAATEDIAAARVAADGGEHAGAARILGSRLEAVDLSAAGDAACAALKEELRDLSARVGDRQKYEQTGRTCLLAGMSSHAQQRASGMELQSASNSARVYLTPKMEKMVDMSREERSSGKQQPDGSSSQLKPIKQDLSEKF